MEASKASGRRVSVSGMLKYLGVSRSGYNAFRKHKQSETEKRMHRIMKLIRQIYDDSYQNYGAPKITQELRKKGECEIKSTTSSVETEASSMDSAIEGLAAEALSSPDGRSTITANGNSQNAYAAAQNTLTSFGSTLSKDAGNIRSIHLEFKEYDDMVSSLMNIGDK